MPFLGQNRHLWRFQAKNATFAIPRKPKTRAQNGLFSLKTPLSLFSA
jgi:hypothetical protein